VLTVNSTIFGNPASATADCVISLGGAATAGGDGLNLISSTDASCNPIPNQGTMDLATFLSPLADNGGDTETRALVDDVLNPALDSGDTTTAALVGSFDQRGTGFDCVFNGTPDIGAFELQSVPVEPTPEPTPESTPEPTPDPTPDPGDPGTTPGQPGTTPVQPEDLGVEQLPATGESPFWTRIIRFVLGLGQ
jgi:hypothetical protein